MIADLTVAVMVEIVAVVENPLTLKTDVLILMMWLDPGRAHGETFGIVSI